MNNYKGGLGAQSLRHLSSLSLLQVTRGYPAPITLSLIFGCPDSLRPVVSRDVGLSPQFDPSVDSSTTQHCPDHCCSGTATTNTWVVVNLPLSCHKDSADTSPMHITSCLLMQVRTAMYHPEYALSCSDVKHTRTCTVVALLLRGVSGYSAIPRTIKGYASTNTCVRSLCCCWTWTVNSERFASSRSYQVVNFTLTIPLAKRFTFSFAVR